MSLIQRRETLSLDEDVDVNVQLRFVVWTTRGMILNSTTDVCFDEAQEAS